MYIVEHPIMQDESREAQIDATAVQDVDTEIKKIGVDERADAERLAPAFAQGLRAASGGTLRIDDTTREGNDIADAFARFLVSPDLATSQSEPLSGGHFAYTFDVNWPRLRAVAQRAGVDLDRALKSEQGAG
jgi:hypothetical protein